MSYGDGGVEDDAEAGEAASGDVGPGDDGGNNDVQSMVDTFSEFTTGNFNNTNFGGNEANTNFSVGSQKGGQSTKGGNFASDYAMTAYAAPAPQDLSKAGQNELAMQAREAATSRALGQQQSNALAATAVDEDGFMGMFGRKSPAAEDMAKYGEFYQAGFSKDINNVANPGASRSGLAPSMAVDIATNPFGRFSSTGEKVAAAAQMALPGGSIIGAARALGMMNTTGLGGQPGSKGKDDSNVTTGPTRSTPKPLTRTQTNNNKTTLNVGPSRSTLRGYGRGTRRVY
tara:strand:- start:5468 stop:6325 length:858 start_codon:yes stop_codon:yes gene_type:complete